MRTTINERIITQTPKVNVVRGRKNVINQRQTNYDPANLSRLKVNDLRQVVKDISGIFPQTRTKKTELIDMVNELTNVVKPMTINQIQNVVENRIIADGSRLMPIEEFTNLINDNTLSIQVLERLMSKYVILLSEDPSVNQRGRSFKITSLDQFNEITQGDYQPMTDSERWLIDQVDTAQQIGFNAKFITFIPKNQNLFGGFFPYINKTRINLMDLQIYNPKQLNKKLEFYDTCLISTLRYYGLSDIVLEELKLNGTINTIQDGYDTKYLDEISNIIGKAIELKYIYKDNSLKTRCYNKTKYDDSIVICLVNGHFFPYIPEFLQATRYSLKNYQELKNKRDFASILKKRPNNKYEKTNDVPWLSSIEVVQLLIENSDNFEPLNHEQLQHLYQSFEIDDNINLDLIDEDKLSSIYNYYKMNENDEQEIIETNNKKIYVENVATLFFDVECEHENKEPTEIRAVEADIECDIETISINPDRHEEYILNEFNYRGSNSGRNFIHEIVNVYGLDTKDEEINQITLIAHNAHFDSSFIFNYIYNPNVVEKDNRFYCLEGMVYNQGKRLKLKIIDSMNFIAGKLEEFPKKFGITGIRKGIMNYEFITKNNINKIGCSVEEFITGFSNKKKQRFINDITELNMITEDGKYFKFNAYREFYLRQDVNILAIGFLKFRAQIKTLCYDLQLPMTIDVLDTLTISSVGDKIAKLYGCYEGVAEVHGSLAQIYSKWVIGGHCQTSENKIQLRGGINESNNYPNRKTAKLFPSKDDDDYEYHYRKAKEYIEKNFYSIETLIQLIERGHQIIDSDYNSLYPSSMKNMNGFPIGKPLRIKPQERNIEFLNNQTYYIAIVKINKFKKYLKFPMVSKVVNGIRDWSNTEGIYYLTKTTIDDLINFQGIDYEILDGYYYNQGRNDKIVELIDTIYYKRLELKKLGNPLQTTYKLIMNSIFGKTIQKITPYSVKIIKGIDNLFNYISKYSNRVVEYKMIGEIQENNKYQFYKLKLKKPTFKYKALSIVGIEILAHSKHLMNKVLNICEENNLDVVYMDTDSVHLPKNHYITLRQIYQEKYGYELEGKGLMQMSSDFESDILTKNEDIFSIQTICIDKKLYIDKITTMTDLKNGIFDYHIKLKGIRLDSFLQFCDEHNFTPEEVFYLIAKNKYYFNIDLMSGIDDDGSIINHADFNVNNFSIIKRLSFSRTISLKVVN